jgi:hypothetical protein
VGALHGGADAAFMKATPRRFFVRRRPGTSKSMVLSSKSTRSQAKPSTAAFLRPVR